jgi:iron complex outermembrane receptor protein
VVDVNSPLSGGNLLARWGRPAGARSRLQLQMFYTRTNRDERPVAESRDTVDVDFQHSWAWRPRHQLLWGAGYRRTSGRAVAVGTSGFGPPRRVDDLVSGFVQDEFSVTPDLRMTVGSKFEHNDYSGYEIQPSARLAWQPRPSHTLWGAVTRAVRTPSRVETDYTTASVINPAVPIFVRLDPNPAFVSEELIAYEAGLRTRLLARGYVTASAFYNRHDDVLSTEVFPVTPDPPSASVRLVVPVTFGNGLEGRSAGVEVTSDVRFTDWWRWTVNYAYLSIDLVKKPGSLDGPQERRNEGLSPNHQLEVQTAVDISPEWSLDVLVRRVSQLREGPVPAYTTGNIRLGWRMTPQLEISIVGQDLFQDHHLEWSGGASSVEIRRSAYVGFSWRR